MISESIAVQLIQGGENDSVEFKSGVPPDDIIGKLVSAFANANGGYIFIGVSDKGEIVGLNIRVNMAIYQLRKTVKSMLPMPADVDTLSVNGKEIIVIEVPKILPAYSPLTTSAGIPYIRKGSEIESMSMDYLLAVKSKPEELKIAQANAKENEGVKIFVAMSFRNEEEPSLQDYWNAMKRAKDRSGIKNLDINRIDLKEGDFEISQQILTDIQNSDIVIADFTLSSRNVYFELGFARGRGKTIIQTAKKGEKLEFDTQNWKTTFYRNATELEEKIIPEIKYAHSQVMDARKNKA